MRGFDFICVDAEHAPVNVPCTYHLFQAIRSGNPHCASLVRVPGADYDQVKRYADAGADGVVCPFVNTKDQARSLVDAVKYPPLGKRGIGFARSNQYGWACEERDLMASNDETLVVAQIEHYEAVINIDEIISQPGIDVAFIGPFDLSASMGIPGKFYHPDFVTAVRTVLTACQKHGVAAGTFETDIAAVERRVDEGYKMIAYSMDTTMLMRSCEAAVSAFKNRDAGTPVYDPSSRFD